MVTDESLATVKGCIQCFIASQLEECFTEMLHFDEMMTYLTGLKHGAETTLALGEGKRMNEKNTSGHWWRLKQSSKL